MSEVERIGLEEIERIIRQKINEFVEKYDKYPKYLKLPLWISNYMKQRMRDVQHLNLDYNTELLLYMDLVVCETITISELEEIEVFWMSKEEIKEAKDRLKILLKDECDCSECIKNKNAYKTLLQYSDQLEQENKTLKQCLTDNNTKNVNEHLYLGNPDM